jgi:hypothetical protein
MARTKPNSAPKDSTATIGFEAKLWLTADKLRNNMDAAEPSGARQITEGDPQGEQGPASQIHLRHRREIPNVEWRNPNSECAPPSTFEIRPFPTPASSSGMPTSRRRMTAAAFFANHAILRSTLAPMAESSAASCASA